MMTIKTGTMKKTINQRKSLKITKHLKVIEKKLNTIMSSPNRSLLNQSGTTAPITQQMKEKCISKKVKTYKSSLANKLLKELEKQIELLNKLKIENDILKEMHFFKCCCAKKRCKTTKIKMHKKARKNRNVNEMKHATQLELIDNKNNSISFENISSPDQNPTAMKDIPEFDKISIFNEKLTVADQKSSNFVFVSPVETIRTKNTVAPSKDLKIAQNVVHTKTESLFSESTKYPKNESNNYKPEKIYDKTLKPNAEFEKINHLQKYYRQDITETTKSIENRKENNNAKIIPKNFKSQEKLDNSFCVSPEKKKKKLRTGVTDICKSNENPKENINKEKITDNLGSQRKVDVSFSLSPKKEKKTQKNKIESTKSIEKSNKNNNTEIILENFESQEIDDSFCVSQKKKKKKERKNEIESSKSFEILIKKKNTEVVPENIKSQEKDDSFYLSQKKRKKEERKNEIESVKSIEKQIKNNNNEKIPENIESQEKDDSFCLSQKKKKKEAQKKEIESVKSIENNNTEMITKNIESQEKDSLLFLSQKKRKKEERKNEIEPIKSIEKLTKNKNTEVVPENIKSQEKDDSFYLSQKKRKKEAQKNEIESVKSIEKLIKNKNTEVISKNIESQEKDDSFCLSQKKKKEEQKNIIESAKSIEKPKENINNKVIPNNFKSQEKIKKSEPEITSENNKETTLILTNKNIIVKDVRKNTIESIISIDKIIEEANKKIEDKKDIWYSRKTSKGTEAKVNENFIKVDNPKNMTFQKDGPKIITSTQELIDERELHLVINKNEDVESNFNFTEVNPKPIKKKSKARKDNKATNNLKKWIKLNVSVEKKTSDPASNTVSHPASNAASIPASNAVVNNKKPEALVKNDAKTNIENVERKFLKPDANPKIKSRKVTDTTTGMNISIERSDKRLKVLNESTNKIANSSNVSNNLSENKKLREICKRVELWKEYGSPWVDEFVDLSMPHTFPKPDEVIFEDSSFCEADEMKFKGNQVKKLQNQSTQTLWESPNLSPIPKI